MDFLFCILQVLYDPTAPALSAWTTSIDTTVQGSPSSPSISFTLVFSEPVAWASETSTNSGSSSTNSSSSSIRVINAELVNVTTAVVNAVNDTASTALTRDGVLAVNRYSLVLKALPGVKVEVLLPEGSFVDVAGNAAVSAYGMMVSKGWVPGGGLIKNN